MNRGRQMLSHHLPDWPAVGAQVALARRALGLKQAELAAQIGIGRTALAKIETGNRQLSALELVALSRATELPIGWFVSESPPAVVSRRASNLHEHGIVEVYVDVLAREVSQLLEVKLLQATPSRFACSVPADVRDAERAALDLRDHLDIGTRDRVDLEEVAEALGVFAYSLAVEQDDVGGSYMAIDDQHGVALVNGTQQPGRRRFTLAHEIGHHVFQDAYAVDGAAAGGSGTERMIDAFAIHLLLPRDALHQRWHELAGKDDSRRAAIVLASEYRLSWTALCGHLANLGLLDGYQGEDLRENLPRRGEYLDLGVEFVSELVPPQVPQRVAQAVLRGYRHHLLGLGRTLELLHGTLREEDLPEREGMPRPAIAAELWSA